LIIFGSPGVIRVKICAETLTRGIFYSGIGLGCISGILSTFIYGIWIRFLDFPNENIPPTVRVQHEKLIGVYFKMEVIAFFAYF
jgi:hypothetical protein